MTKPNVPDLMLHNDGTVMSPNWQLYRIISDVIGTVRAVVKVSTLAVVETYTTYAYNDDFGGITNNPTYQPFGFAGGLLDNWLGIVHFGARDYSGWQRRWLSKDHIRQAGGLNLYQYCGADPVNCIDPSGRDPFVLPWWVSLATGGVAPAGGGLGALAAVAAIPFIFPANGSNGGNPVTSLPNIPSPIPAIPLPLPPPPLCRAPPQVTESGEFEMCRLDGLINGICVYLCPSGRVGQGEAPGANDNACARIIWLPVY